MTLIEPSAGYLRVETAPEYVPDELDTAIIQAVTYSDIFDYPITSSEIYRYLARVYTTREQIETRLRSGLLVPRYLAESEGYYCLPGREHIVSIRRERQQTADSVWPRALFYGGLIASLPFVRMVAITGELAMDNSGPTSDIDYFIVTEPERLWLCRLMVVAVVRYAAPRGDIICPNFLLSERALTLQDRNLYTAHEVAQMVPIFGLSTYETLLEMNGWVGDYLPNARSSSRSFEVQVRARRSRKFLETLLRTRLGSSIESWEMRRKIRKFSPGSHRATEASFSVDWCKGHVDGHGERVLTLFGSRWDEVEGRMQ